MNNPKRHCQQKILSNKIFYCWQLYSARTATGQNLTEHMHYIKTLVEHLLTIDNEIDEKDLVITLISSFLEEYNHLTSALETIANDDFT